MELLESIVSHGNNKVGGLLATFGFFLEGRWNVRTPGDSSEFHPFQIDYKTTLVFTQSQFSFSSWSISAWYVVSFHHQNRPLLAVQFQFQLDLNYFAETFQFWAAFAKCSPYWELTKGKFPVPVLGVDKFGPFVSLWAGAWAVWPISHLRVLWQGGTLGQGEVLPSTRPSSLLLLLLKLLWGQKLNCSDLTVLLDITSLSPFLLPALLVMQTIGAWPTELLWRHVRRRRNNWIILDRSHWPNAGSCRWLKWIGAGGDSLEQACHLYLQASLTAETQQGGKVAKWQGGKVARWQGGKVARWQW